MKLDVCTMTKLSPVFPLMLFAFVLLATSCNTIKPVHEASASPVIINRDTLTIEAGVTNSFKELRTRHTKDYHWYKAGKIMITKGGADGRALHGSYTSFYRDKNLSEKGQFRKGVKVGQWTRWWEGGMIRQVCRYRGGRLNGKCFNYDGSGTLESKMKYKSGQRSGWSTFYTSDSTITKVKYRKGVEVKSETPADKQARKDEKAAAKAQKKSFKEWWKGIRNREPENLEPAEEEMNTPKEPTEDGTQS